MHRCLSVTRCPMGQSGFPPLLLNREEERWACVAVLLPRRVWGAATQESFSNGNPIPQEKLPHL